MKLSIAAHLPKLYASIAQGGLTPQLNPTRKCLLQSNTSRIHQIRCLQTKKLSRNLEFSTSSDAPLPMKQNSLKLTNDHLNQDERPLVLLYSWLMAKEKHVKKYAQFYTDNGLDVLTVNTSPADLLRPTKGTQVMADHVLEFLHTNPVYQSIVFHGFSVGAYAFSEVMVKIARNMEKHGDLLDRFAGQIIDSGADLAALPHGFSQAVTKNKFLQSYIKNKLERYLEFQYDIATRHYEAGSEKTHECFLNVPSLLLFSKIDPISDDKFNNDLASEWEQKGIRVYTKCWDNSRHVSHYHMHKKEYENELYAFLEAISMLSNAAKIRIKNV